MLNTSFGNWVSWSWLSRFIVFMCDCLRETCCVCNSQENVLWVLQVPSRRSLIALMEANWTAENEKKKKLNNCDFCYLLKCSKAKTVRMYSPSPSSRFLKSRILKKHLIWHFAWNRNTFFASNIIQLPFRDIPHRVLVSLV